MLIRISTLNSTLTVSSALLSHCGSPELIFQLSASAALEDKLANLTVEQKEALEKDLAKKERKEEAKAEKEEARVKVSSRLSFRLLHLTERFSSYYRHPRSSLSDPSATSASL